MNGIGDILRVLNMEMVIGTISNTVVTLSINIDIVAVKMQNITINLHIFPLDALLIFTPRYRRLQFPPILSQLSSFLIEDQLY